MHELTITNALLATVFDFAERHKAKKILTVKLKIGKLQRIVPEILRFCFSESIKETIASDAKLEMDEVDISIKCSDCGEIASIKNFEFICPNCGGYNLDTISGEELLIDSIEVE